MKREAVRRARDEVVRLAGQGLDGVAFSTQASNAIARVVPFQRSCWHTVDPGTVLFTGSVNHQVTCSGTWLAEYEYVVEDVNKWWFLARSGRRAGATSLATHGDLSRSLRYRSHAAYGIGDELRGSFVADGTYWGAAGFLRDRDEAWFTHEEVAFLASLSEPLAEGLRRARWSPSCPPNRPREVPAWWSSTSTASWSPYPRPRSSGSSRWSRSRPPRRRRHDGQDPLELSARSRARTRSGSWLLLYGTRLAGGAQGRTAVIIQPATPGEVAPLVALAYGLTEREVQVTRLCLRGCSAKQMAQRLHVSPYTVQDHLKAIFDKTGARSRGELVGQVFLEHVVPRWEPVADCPPGWTGLGTPAGAAAATSPGL